VYFDLKDEAEPAIVKCFAVVHAMPGPLQDGMRVRVSGSPRLHPLYNFSFQVQHVVPVGEGSLRQAADLLRAKLEQEGLVDATRKRSLPSFPRHIALITAGQSAAYADFIKIAKARWAGLLIDHYDVLVQGAQSPEQIVRAIGEANAQPEVPEVIVLVRGGGSTEDLAAFSDERVVRTVAASRVPTLVAIGHEVDVALAELAADVRASTPSNAAELLLPDRAEEQRHINEIGQSLDTTLNTFIVQKRQHIVRLREQFDHQLTLKAVAARQRIAALTQLLHALDPRRPLEYGYALVRQGTMVIRRAAAITPDQSVSVEFVDGTAMAVVQTVNVRNKEEP
jgi:exodeoxyribonuclease VII large subunit